MSDNTFSLDDLNELSEGLGDNICSLLNKVNGCWSIASVEEEVEALLSTYNVKPSEVLVTKGKAKGLLLNDAFAIAKQNIAFRIAFKVE